MKLKFICVFVVILPFDVMADSIRTSDGTSCSFDTSSSPYQLKAYIENGSDTSNEYSSGYSNDSYQDDRTVGIEFTYKFGGSDRLDCGKLYQLELETKLLELQIMKERATKLEAAQSIDWD
ncbi:hypothetical protein [Vibrio splendidus]|uniref:hypothetical protein n=1 Tax=Vibrio splendidus TaxID=29497 RepID=UPI000D392C12|nr:hypothetical protein [Vibrio splendidus]PTP50621.1 hypothetical protein CWO05_19960 [Vibrio splendidus]